MRLVLNVSLKTQPDVVLQPGEELDGTASVQFNDLPTSSVDGFRPIGSCSFCTIDVVFGEPFPLRLRATSRVAYSYNSRNPQLFTGTVIPADTGSIVQIQSLFALAANGLREDGVLLNTAGAPEPSTVVMAASGILLVWWRRKSRVSSHGANPVRISPLHAPREEGETRLATA